MGGIIGKYWVLVKNLKERTTWKTVVSVRIILKLMF
jgi:hypothetical protein